MVGDLALTGTLWQEGRREYGKRKQSHHLWTSQSRTSYKGRQRKEKASGTTIEKIDLQRKTLPVPEKKEGGERKSATWQGPGRRTCAH